SGRSLEAERPLLDEGLVALLEVRVTHAERLRLRLRLEGRREVERELAIERVLRHGEPHARTRGEPPMRDPGARPRDRAQGLVRGGASRRSRGPCRGLGYSDGAGRPPRERTP